MIRPYVADDLDHLLDAWYEASLIAHPFLTEEFLVAERRQIAEDWMPVAETVVFEDDGRVVGFLSLNGDEVGAIFVHPDWQRRGIGRTLMDHAASRRESLELEVFEANGLGRAFYDAYGFVFANRRIDEPTGQPMLRLRLGEAASGS